MRKILLLVVAALLLAGGTALWLSPARAPRGASPAAVLPAADAAEAKASVEKGPAAAPSSPRARRMAGEVERAKLLADIRRAREARAVARTQPGARRPGGAGPGGSEAGSEEPAIDKEYIRGAVRAIVPLVKECYELALSRDPKLAGRVVMHFTIEGDPEVGGLIGSAEEREGTTLQDAEFLECMRQTMYAIEIDPPAQGGQVQVTYPFEFHSSDEEP